LYGNEDCEKVADVPLASVYPLLVNGPEGGNVQYHAVGHGEAVGTAESKLPDKSHVA
jgi:hypothetical protein